MYHSYLEALFGLETSQYAFYWTSFLYFGLSPSQLVDGNGFFSEVRIQKCLQILQFALGNSVALNSR